jgi:hypothetical protein
LGGNKLVLSEDFSVGRERFGEKRLVPREVDSAEGFGELNVFAPTEDCSVGGREGLGLKAGNLGAVVAEFPDWEVKAMGFDEAN